MLAILDRLRTDIAGVTALEYGLIGALIAVVVTAAVKKVGVNAAAKFSAIAVSLQ